MKRSDVYPEYTLNAQDNVYLVRLQAYQEYSDKE